MKKLLTLLTLLVVAVTGAWADEPTPGNADSKYLDIANYSTIQSTFSPGTGLSYKYYDSENGVLTLLASAVTANGTNQNWVTVRNGGTSSKTWSVNNVTDADYFKGNTGYKSSGNVNAASIKGTQSGSGGNRNYSFRVTNCTQVRALINSSNASRTVTMTVYPVTGENYDTRGEAAGSSSDKSNAVKVLKVTGLSTSTVYEVFITSDSSSESLLYELAFFTPVLSDVAAPTSLTCSAQTSTSLTYTWTKAEHASGYTATLYSDSECTSSVATQNLGDVATVTFNTLSASTTYYCKVQSKGDGTSYKVNGGTTTAVSGTTSAKAYTVTAASNNNEWGTASAGAGSLDEGEITDITASAEEGYKFSSWAVSGEGAGLSSTSTNPTTLTMGTENAVVTATFRALETYAITYNPGENGTGSIDAGEKTEDTAFTLSSETFTRDGYVQTGWALTDGGDKAYELGGSYETNAAQTFYPFWTAAFTLTYEANGGTGTMTNSQGVGSITLTHNAYTKSGYAFIGWATSQANADAGTVAYADKASYNLAADATLFAVWGENDTYLVPATSGSAPSSGDVINMQSGSLGGSIIALSSNLTYTTNGLQFGTNSGTKAKVTLDRNMQEGTIIVMTLVSAGESARGLHLYTNAATPAKVSTIGWSSATTSGEERTFTYTVKAGDTGFIGSNVFQLWRNNTVQLKSLSVINLVEGWTISASGWNTLSCNSKLDLSTITNGTAYVATASGENVTLTKSTAKVAAGTGLMIKGEPNAVFTISTTNEDTEDVTNLLVGLPNGGTVSANDNNYVFAWQTADVSTAGFYFVNDAEPTLGAGKAFLHTNGSGGAKLNIIVEEGETDGIGSIENGKLNIETSVYNLAGQKVDAAYKGIVIVNGKKYVRK